MRVWYQSATSIGKDPLWADYEKALTSHVQAIKRSDIDIDVRGVQNMVAGLGTYRYFSLLNTNQVIINAMRAQKEGYDAIFIGCMQNPGYYEIREVVDIPVCFVCEAAVHLATMLAPNFAFLYYSEPSMRRTTKRVQELGFAHRLVPTGNLGMTLEGVQKGFTNPDPIIKACETVARKAADSGATMLISACNCLNMVLVHAGVNELAGIPFLDSVATLIKTGEMMLELNKLGVKRSWRGDFSRPSKEELTHALKVYQVEI